MAFKRAVLPAAEPQDAEALTAAMAGIGMGFAVVPALDPNIEDTLLRASVEPGVEGRLVAEADDDAVVGLAVEQRVVSPGVVEDRAGNVHLGTAVERLAAEAAGF